MFEKIGKNFKLRGFIQHPVDSLPRLFQTLFGKIEQFVGTFDLLNSFITESTATQPLPVDTMWFRRLPRCHHIGWQIHADSRPHPGEAVGAHPAELVHFRESTQDGVSSDLHMAAQGRGIGHNDMVLQQTIVGDMNIGHQQIVIADPCHTLVLHGSAMQGGEFTDNVAIADLQDGRLAGIFHVLGILPNRGELVDPVVPANLGRPLDHHMGADFGTCCNLDPGANDGEGTNSDPFIELGIRIDNCAWVDQLPISRAVHMISAVATVLSSTFAEQVKKPMPRFILV